jgi:hypothetical protein
MTAKVLAIVNKVLTVPRHKDVLIAPAARSFLTMWLSYLGVLPSKAREPAVVGIPSSADVPMLSLFVSTGRRGYVLDNYWNPT